MPTKRLTVYPTYGYRAAADDGRWHIPMRAWVRNELPIPYQDAAIRLCFDDEGGLTEAGLLRLKECLKDFVAVDNEGEAVRFKFDGDPEGEEFRLSRKTDDNGLVVEEFDLPDETARRILAAQPSGAAGSGRWLRLSAETKGLSGTARAAGVVRLLEPQGLSVVSDIDDTIKVTEIPAGKRTVLRRTFLMDYEATEGMRDRYLKILERNSSFDNVSFHYVSGSPWQLFRLLHEFLVEKTGFPPGTFHMKSVNWNVEDLAASFRDINKLLSGPEDTERQKTDSISELMSRCPGRKFILVGDTGERDPEVFAKMKQRFGEQVVRIYIRDVNELGDRHERLKDMLRIDPRGVCIQEDGGEDGGEG